MGDPSLAFDPFEGISLPPAWIDVATDLHRVPSPPGPIPLLVDTPILAAYFDDASTNPFALPTLEDDTTDFARLIDEIVIQPEHRLVPPRGAGAAVGTAVVASAVWPHTSTKRKREEDDVVGAPQSTAAGTEGGPPRTQPEWKKQRRHGDSLASLLVADGQSDHIPIVPPLPKPTSVLKYEPTTNHLGYSVTETSNGLGVALSQPPPFMPFFAGSPPPDDPYRNQPPPPLTPHRETAPPRLPLASPATMRVASSLAALSKGKRPATARKPKAAKRRSCSATAKQPSTGRRKNKSLATGAPTPALAPCQQDGAATFLAPSTPNPSVQTPSRASVQKPARLVSQLVHPTDHKGLVQEKMCRALPHSLVPAGVHKFNNKTTKRDFQCAICHNPKIGDPQGQWFRRDLLCDPEIAAVCMACWRVYTNFTEKVKKEPGYVEFTLMAPHIQDLRDEHVDVVTPLILEGLKAAFASYYYRRRTGGQHAEKSRQNKLIAQYFWSDILGAGGLDRACFCGKIISIANSWGRCDCWEATFPTFVRKDVSAGDAIHQIEQVRALTKQTALEIRHKIVVFLQSKYSGVKWSEEVLRHLKELGSE